MSIDRRMVVISTALAVFALASAAVGAPQMLDVIAHGSREKRVVALTFDADMTPGMLRRLKRGSVKSWYDERSVEFLKTNAVTATVFVTGLWAQTYPEVVRALSQDPLFEIGNHSFTHAAFRTPCYHLAPVRDKKAEVTETQETLRQLTGRSPAFFRFPGGCYSPEDVGLIHSYGLRIVGWDVNSGDAFSSDAAGIAERVVRTAQNGSIIVMHLDGGPNAPATSRALPLIVKGLKDRGFSFASVSQLISPAISR